VLLGLPVSLVYNFVAPIFVRINMINFPDVLIIDLKLLRDFSEGDVGVLGNSIND